MRALFKNKNLYSLFGCAFIFCFSVYSQNINKKIDSLEILLNDTKDLIGKINLNLKLSSLKLHSKTEDVLGHLNAARHYVNEIGDDSLLFDIYSKYLNYYFLNQKHEYTFAYIDSALIFKNTVSPNKLVKIYTTLAQNSNFIGEFDKAIKTYKTALEICSTNNLDRLKSGIFVGLSSSYINQKEFDKAEFNALEAVKWSQKNGSLVNEMHARLGLGKLYFETKEVKKALKCYKAVEDYLRTNSNIILSHALNTNLGRLFRAIKNYDKAIFYFNENLKINTSFNNDIGMNTSRTDIALVLLVQKKYDESIAILKENLEHAKRIDNPKMMEQNLLDLSIVYEQKNSLKKALDYRKLYEKWQDSIVSTENLNAISELDIKYQTEKKENEILQLSKQKLEDKIALDKQSLWIKRLGFALLTAVIVFGALFTIYKQRIKHRRQKELIGAITETQISEQQRISQDLHDSIGGSLAFVKTQLNGLEKTTSNQKVISTLIQTVTKTSDEVRQISHNLMPGELVKFGLKPAIESLLNEVKSETLSTNLYAHDVEDRFDAKKEVHLFRIVQELVQNVLKHANADVLNIYLNKRNRFLNLIVEDDGVGFNPKNKKDKGIGFKTIENRVTYLNGELKIDSHKNSGSSFNIMIPL